MTMGLTPALPPVSDIARRRKRAARHSISDSSVLRTHTFRWCEGRNVRVFGVLPVLTARQHWIRENMASSIILQRFLDRLALAIMQGRFEDYLTCVGLPLSIVTSAARIVVRTEDELAEGFDELSEMLCCRGASEARLIVLRAEYDGPDRIVGLYESHYLCDGRPLVPRFYTRIWLERCDGTWKTTRVHNTTSETRWPILLTRVDADQCLPMEFLT